MALITWWASTMEKSPCAPLDGTEVVRLIKDPGGTPSSARATTGDIANLTVQAAIRTTDSSGQVNWTFPVPYGVGVVPVVSADVLATANQPYSVRLIGSGVTNTGVNLQILGAAIVSILSISVLAALVSAGAGIQVHLVARKPTP